MSEAPVSGRIVFKAFAWFFAALSMVALLSPPGATHDEWYHATSIWCGHGVRALYCSEIGDDPKIGYSAATNLDAINCQRGREEPLLCPTGRSKENRFQVNDGQYPGLFYFSFSWLVVPSVDVSFVLMRVVNALLISSLLAMAFWLLPPRHRLVLFLVVLTTFTATGYMLFASINPSSWTSIGVGLGWLCIHAALVSIRPEARRRAALLSLGAVLSLMAVGSRWDAIPFVLFAISLAIFHAAWVRYPNIRKRLMAAAVSIPVIGFAVLRMFAPARLYFDPGLLYRYDTSERDNLAFLSENLLQGVPNALRALGTVPSMDGIVMPDLVFIAALTLLGFVITRTFAAGERVQIVGLIVISVVIAFVIAAQVALIDDRDSGGVEPRYVYPLLLLAIGWWYLTGPSDLPERVARYLRSVSGVAVALFGLALFVPTERFVDRQTYGIRYLPEGPDQWWWSWMPFGPNVVFVLAVVCLWLSFRSLAQILQPRADIGEPV